MYLGVLEAPNPSKIELRVTQVSQNEPYDTQGVPNEHLGHPRGSQKGPLVTQGGPKVDQDGLRDPFGTQGGSKTQTGPRRYLGVPPFLDLLWRTWSLQGPILDSRGVPKSV